MHKQELEEHLTQIKQKVAGEGLSTMALRRLHAETMAKARAAATADERYLFSREGGVMLELVEETKPRSSHEDRVADLHAQGNHGMAQNLQKTLDRRAATALVASAQEKVDSTDEYTTVANDNRNREALKAAIAARDEVVNRPSAAFAAAEKQRDMRSESDRLSRQSYAMAKSTVEDDRIKGEAMAEESKRLLKASDQIPQGAMAALAHEKGEL